MKEYGINASDPLACFGQIYGMCDHVSFSLSQAGYAVYKYVPFGPMDEVLPYVCRRAEENHGVLEKVVKERSLLSQEIIRRMSLSDLFHEVKAGVANSRS